MSTSTLQARQRPSSVPCWRKDHVGEGRVDQNDVAPGLLKHQPTLAYLSATFHCTSCFYFPSSVLMCLYFLLCCQPHPCPPSHYFLPDSQLLQ